MSVTQRIRAGVQEFWEQHAIGRTKEDAFPTWWLHKKYEVAPADAVAHSSQGSHDLGMDAFHIEWEGKKGPTLHIIQGKFTEDIAQINKAIAGFGTTLRELARILEGSQVENVGKQVLFEKIAAELDRGGVSGESVRIHFEIVHLCAEGNEVIFQRTAAARQRFEDTAATFLPNNLVTLKLIYPDEVVDIGVIVAPGEQQTLRFSGAELETAERVKYFTGLGYLSDLVELYKERREALFAKNVRLFLYKLADTGPVKYMRDTLRRTCLNTKSGSALDPGEFAVLHNGVTLHAMHAQFDGDSVTVRSLSVLNGCQTIKNAYLFATDPQIRNRIDTSVWTRIRLPMRIVVTADEDLVRRVTVSNNRQTAIRPSAFRANDPLQLRLAERFREIGVYYERQEGAFMNLMRSEPAQMEEEYRNSPNRPLLMEEVAQVIAIVGDRPALSVAAKVSDLFDDKIYEHLFSDKHTANLKILLFLRNMFSVMHLVLKDLKERSSRLEGLPQSRFRYPITKLLARYVAKYEPGLVAEFGDVVMAHAGPRDPLRNRLEKLCTAQNSGLQQLIPDVWSDSEERTGWVTATNKECVDRALGRMRLREIDVFDRLGRD
jgi:hypothetical protein